MSDWKKAAVTPQATMRDALSAIDGGRMYIALVVDGTCHLLGTVTDGDIRRALLHGSTLETPVTQVMNPHPVTGLVDEDDIIWQRTMARHQLRHLPLLSADGCVVDLVRYRPPAEPERDNLVVLMAGGLGTRLRPLTETVPKPLLTIGNKPILETIVENFVSQGFSRFVLCINYRGAQIREHFGDGRRWGVEIRYVEEPSRMGTAGALSLLPERPTKPFFVMNGDLLTKVDFVRLLTFHHQREAAATLCVREYSHQIPYGVVEMDRYRVTHLVEKPMQHYWVNAGIYLLQPDTLDLIPPQRFFDMTELLGALTAAGRTVTGFPLREYWIDIGQVGEFEQAHNDYEEYFA